MAKTWTPRVGSRVYIHYKMPSGVYTVTDGICRNLTRTNHGMGMHGDKQEVIAVQVAIMVGNEEVEVSCKPDRVYRGREVATKALCVWASEQIELMVKTVIRAFQEMG